MQRTAANYRRRYRRKVDPLVPLRAQVEGHRGSSPSLIGSGGCGKSSSARRLTDVDFGTLERADLLVLEENAVLANVAPGALATFDRLELTNDPSLDPGAFDAVRTFELVVTNAEPASP